MKYGLALEGGGAKGAYHVGAVKALIENGYEFGAVTGTSIGSINAAMIAQKDIETLEKIWREMKYSTLFDIDEDKLQRALNINLDIHLIRYLSKRLGNALKEGGIDTAKIRGILEAHIDEDKIRASDIKFGLVTVCVSDKKAQELFIEDIPQGKLIDYIMASSSLPVFKTMTIDEKKYLDGGVYDNCPVHMLEQKGYSEVFAIRTYKRLRIRDYKNIIKRDNVKIHMIAPYESLSNILNFDNENLNQLLELGYFDALKSIKKLDGYRYYVNFEKEKYFSEKIENIKIEEIEKIIRILKLDFVINTNVRKTFIDIVLPLLIAKTKIKKAASYKESIYGLLEYVAIKENIERFKIYDFDEFLKEVKLKMALKNKSRIDQAIYKFVKSIS
jgi:NTE family protein